MGVEALGPLRGIDQATSCSRVKVVGSWVSEVDPVKFGPRHWGQSAAWRQRVPKMRAGKTVATVERRWEWGNMAENVRVGATKAEGWSEEKRGF